MVTPVRDKAESAFARGTLVAAAGLMVGFAARFIFNITVTRILGRDQAGSFFEFMAVALLLAVIGRLGLERLSLREVAVHYRRDDPASARGAACWFILIVIACSSILAALGYWQSHRIAQVFGMSDPQPGLTLLLWAVPGLALSILLAQMLRGLHQVGRASWVQSITMYIVAISLGWSGLVLGYRSTGWLALSFVIGTVAACVLGLGLMRRTKLWRAVRRDPELCGHRILPSTVLFFYWTSLSAYALGGFDVLLVAIIGQHQQLTADYVAALQTALVCSMGLTAMNNITGPLVAGAFDGGRKDEIEAVTRMSARWSLVLAALAAGFLVIAGEQVLQLFGPEFSSAAPIMLVLVAGHLINSATGPVSLTLQMTGHEKWSAIVLSSTVVVMLCAYVPLISWYGAMGAAIVTSSTMGARNFVLLLIVRRTVRINPLANTLVPVALLLAVCGATAFLARQLPGQFVVYLSIAVYAIAAPIIGWRLLLHSEDRVALGGLIKSSIRRTGALDTESDPPVSYS